MQEFHEMRAKDHELLQQIKQFIKRENDVLSKIINDYGTLQDVDNEISTITRLELTLLTIKEKDIVSMIPEIPDQVIVKHHYSIALTSTPLIIVMITLSTIISLGLGVLYEKNKLL